jgi:hypothetical protein
MGQRPTNEKAASFGCRSLPDRGKKDIISAMRLALDDLPGPGE